MVGKKKGSFYIYLRPVPEKGLDRRVEKRDGWIKNGFGYCKTNHGFWSVTDIESGMSLSYGNFSTLDKAESHAISCKDRIKEAKANQKCIDEIAIFKKLVEIVKNEAGGKINE